MDGAAVTQSRSANLTLALAEQARSVSYDSLLEPVRELARQCVLDYFGVALAGADDPLAQILLDEFSEASGAAQASVIGHKARLPALSVALVNGAIGHALDYDDVNLAMPGHPSVAILPGPWRSPRRGRAPGAKSSPPLSPGTRPPAGSAWRFAPATTISASTPPAPSARSAPRQPAPACLGSTPQ